MMDNKMRQMIATEVRNSLNSYMQHLNEVWLTGEQLTKTFGCFTKTWLKQYGQTLPRTQAIVTDKNGEHRSGWCYPKHKIQEMMLNGSIKNLTVQ